MAKINSNGTIGLIIKIIGLLVVLGGVGTSIIVAFTKTNGCVENNTKEIIAIKPKVELNTEHRLRDEIDGKYIKEKITNIEAAQQQILREVRRSRGRSATENEP